MPGQKEEIENLHTPLTQLLQMNYPGYDPFWIREEQVTYTYIKNCKQKSFDYMRNYNGEKPRTMPI